MTDPRHSMYDASRPKIMTRPIERLGSAISIALEVGHHGIYVYGGGRVGKTNGAHMLFRDLRWAPWPMAVCEMSYSNPTKSTENNFFNALLNSAGLKTIGRALGSDVLARLRNHLVALTQRDSVEIVACLINEANRFSVEHYKHLVSLDNELEHRKKRLFLVLLNQTDADEDGVQGIDHRPPSHIFGRFLSASHHFTGLLWEKPNGEAGNDLLDDVTIALTQFDSGLTWPAGSGISFTEFFAPRAFAAGWRLAHQANLYRQVVEELHAQHGLPAGAPFPMQTFEAFVYFLLVRIAGEDQTFMQFTEDHVKRALKLSGYIELELSRYPERKP